MIKTEITIFKNENGERLFFEEGNLRRNGVNKNSEKITYWNGNTWVTECITFVDRVTRVAVRDETNYDRPIYSYHYEWLIETGYVLKVESSNTSGSLSPFYTKECF